MVTVKKVEGRSMQKAFIDFPLELYKGNPYFVPPLYSDEKLIFSKKNVYYETCEAEYFLAYDSDGNISGRISAFIQKQHNEKTGEKRARFTRFDALDDSETADALFAAAESWAKEKGMEKICGPLGFSDLEREGLLIDGFEWLNTFEEQYNYPYYARLIENCGYVKEADWVEYRLYKPDKPDEKLTRISKAVMEKYNLHMAKFKNKKDLLDRYAEDFFRCVDEGYKDLYGTVPFTEKMKKQMISQFMLIIDPQFMDIVCDKDENVLAFGLSFPAFGETLQKSGGRLTLPTLIRMFKFLKNPHRLDLALISVLPQWQAKGVNAIILDTLMRGMIDKDIEYCETNLNLEYNGKVQSQWKYFDNVQHKRRRSYVKELTK